MVGFVRPPCDAGVIEWAPPFDAALSQRSKRLTLVATIVGSSMAFLDGWLVDQISWRAIFLLNVPLAIAATGLALRFGCESNDPEAKQLDWSGAVTVAIGLAAITWGLSAIPASGLRDKTVLASLGVGTV